MIRVLALYSQRKQHVSMIAVPVLDNNRAAVRRLACILKTFLGLEVIILLVLTLYIPVVDDGAILINPHKTKLNKITQSLSLVLAWKALQYAERGPLLRYLCFLLGSCAGMFKRGFLDISDISIGLSQ